MCGIVGTTDRDSFHLLHEMNSTLSYRGPDDTGKFIDQSKGIAFAMRRLSIIDLETGQQPITNEDEGLWVICNGEIYNSPELKRQLSERGHKFRTKNSDVEVLIHLYEEKGVDLLDDLNGMFAFVIYDKNKEILFGARDRVGIKPFYYAFKNGKFAFASELKSLMSLPWIAGELDFTSIYHYMSLQFVPAPDTIFDEIKKLSAGHYFVYEIPTKRLTLTKYWELDVSRTVDRPSAELEELVREKLKEAVKRWTLSDVPIACSLSGGLDSSSIVGLLALSGEKDIRTYSLGFEGHYEKSYSELDLAEKVAQKWDTSHHEVTLKPGRVLNDLEKMVWHLDEPYGGGLPSWYIYELIGKDHKVALTGTGGDELFGNYGKYHTYEKHTWRRMLGNLKSSWRNSTVKEVRNGYFYPVGHYYPRYFSDAVKDEIIFNGNHRFSCKTEAYLEEIWNKAESDSARNNVAFVDFKLQLPEEFLLVTDRFSMAHSVEARVPFLDHTLVELVFSIPPIIRTGGHEPKSFLKKIVKDLLPVELLNAPKKGFILPLKTWTRKELRPLIEEMLSPDFIKNQGIFSDRCYREVVKPHLDEKRDFTQQVWTLLMFQMWYNVYCNGKGKD